MAQMQITEGDVVYMTCIGIPICYHLGIAVVENGQLCLYHNTPHNANRYGGNILCEPIGEILKDRKVLWVHKGGANCPDIIRQYAYDNRERKWNTFYYNCEDFVSEIRRCQRGSLLRTIWVSGLVFVIARMI